MKLFFHKHFWGMLIATGFFLIGLLTLSDYGLNIDEPIHFIRGHSYLNFFLTGNPRFSGDEFRKPRTSAWKIQQYNAAYFMEGDSGHPPLSGILAAASNKIFFEELGILGDLESYHLYELAVSSFLVFLVYWMGVSLYGRWAGIIASLALASYPLFFGESKFNIKDPIETTWFAATIFCFLRGTSSGKAKYFLWFSVFFALAFATKYNIVFLPFILVPYMLVRNAWLLASPGRLVARLKKIPLPVYASLIAFPLIVFGFHTLIRPYLWADPWGRFLTIAGYYREIGTGKVYQPQFVRQGWNMYPAVFVAVSTPIWTLMLFAVGVLTGVFRLHKEKDKTSLLLLLWFAAPIVRVMWPGTSIYSGVRQIMEYLPPMVLLAGLGGQSAIAWVKRKNDSLSLLAKGIVFAGFLPLAVTLVRYHPNENVFLNRFVGGISGAVARKLPGAAETMGNVYVQGIRWLNEHAERNARFGLPVGLASNIPRQYLRSDIELGPYFSGVKRSGEYMIEMISVDFPPDRYNFLYLDRFLEPVYQVKVDGVTLLKVWKNDSTQLREGYGREQEISVESIEGGVEEGYLHIVLRKPARLVQLIIDHRADSCTAQGSGEIAYGSGGEDNRVMLVPDDLYGMQGPYARSLQTPTRFVYFFPATLASWVRIIPQEANLCLLSYKNIKVFALME